MVYSALLIVIEWFLRCVIEWFLWFLLQSQTKAPSHLVYLCTSIDDSVGTSTSGAYLGRRSAQK